MNLNHVEWNSLRIGDKVISAKETPGTIVGLIKGSKNIHFTRDSDGDYSDTIIIDFNGKISTLAHWECKSIKYIQRNDSVVEYALKTSKNYILHIGLNYTEKGLPHPQQLLLNQIEDALQVLE